MTQARKRSCLEGCAWVMAGPGLGRVKVWQGSGEVVWGDTWHGMTQQQRAAPSLLRHHPRLRPPENAACRWA